MKNLSRLNPYFLKYKWHLILGILFVTGSNYYGILIPQKIREALDLVQNEIQSLKSADPALQSGLYERLSQTLLWFALIVTGYVILKGLLMYAMRQSLIVMSRLIEYDMRKEIFNHLQQLDQSFYKTHKTGDIMARISEDVSKVRNYIGPGLLYGINLVTLFAMTIYAMLKVDVELTIYTLLPLPILSISIYYVSNLINVKSTLIQQQLGKLNSTAQEAYSGIRVIKSYVKEDWFVKYFQGESEEFKKRALSLAGVEAWFQPLMILLIALSTLLVVIVGGHRVYEGSLTAGNIAEFILYVNMLTWPVTAIGWIASVVQEAEASQARINELMDIKPAIINTNHSVYDIRGDIEFRNVSFAYPGVDIPALSNVSFKISKGQKLAILGKTASGKSTIGDLLLRIYDIQHGEILIDGKNIKDHNLAVLRNKIAYVPQDVFLFSDTVSSNISFGVADADDLEIKEHAGYAAVADDIIRLPSGFDTLVGERGVSLSGGQKQRISIARALLKKPDILILDDALSAVDTTTEQHIMQHFNAALADKTVIMITHRANNLLNYDKIIVLDKGTITEEGTHDELIQKGGFYAAVYEQQLVQENL
ncbi:MAG: ABC transporter ATP-binding protein [Saprospiraceae bacterium]|nr:ABC transporter ATP-binding protein [Saprospiraceae bacterium]